MEDNTIELGEPPFVLAPVSESRNGAETLKIWEDEGCFEVWAEQYKDIGPGKKFADSTEYVQATRTRESYRGQ
jgi:hypothetical protein